MGRGIGASGQPKTPSKSLRSCFFAGVMLPCIDGTEREKPPLMLPRTGPIPGPGPSTFLCILNHSRITSQELSFLLPGCCISSSGPSIRGVRGCTHHLCFLRHLDAAIFNQSILYTTGREMLIVCFWIFGSYYSEAGGKLVREGKTGNWEMKRGAND